VHFDIFITSYCTEVFIFSCSACSLYVAVHNVYFCIVDSSISLMISVALWCNDKCGRYGDVVVCFVHCCRGANLSCTSVDAPDRIAMLKAEIAVLDCKEKALDQHKMWVQQSIKNVTDDAGNHEYLLMSKKFLVVKCYLFVINSVVTTSAVCVLQTSVWSYWFFIRLFVISHSPLKHTIIV